MRCRRRQCRQNCAPPPASCAHAPGQGKLVREQFVIGETEPLRGEMTEMRQGSAGCAICATRRRNPASRVAFIQAPSCHSGNSGSRSRPAGWRARGSWAKARRSADRPARSAAVREFLRRHDVIGMRDLRLALPYQLDRAGDEAHLALRQDALQMIGKGMEENEGQRCRCRRNTRRDRAGAC